MSAPTEAVEVARPLDQLATALAAFQAEMPVVSKGKTANVRSEKGSYSYTYAGLADVSEVVTPLLTKHGLAFSCLPGNGVLTGMLLHTSGQFLTGSLPLSGSTPQQVGSALTYMRRYLLGCMTGLVTDDDDDGQAASSPARRSRSRAPQTPGPVERAAAADAPPASSAPGPGLITDPQMRNLRRLLGAYGLGGKDQRDDVLALVADVIGHPVASSKELTKAEAGAVIEYLQIQLGEQPQEESA